MIRSFFFIFLFLLFANGYAQQQMPYSLQQYTDNNGLPQNSVKSIVMDDNGFLWLATEAGLTRFDGSSFLTYEKDATHTLSDRIFTIVKAIKTGKLYAKTEYHEFIPIASGYTLAKPVSYERAFNEAKKNLDLVQELPLKDAALQRFIVQPTVDEKYIISKDSIIFRKGRLNFGAAFRHEAQGSFFTAGKQLIYSNNKGKFTLFKAGVPTDFQFTGDILKEAPFYKRLKIYWNNSTDQAFITLNENIYQLVYTPNGLTTKLIITGFDLEGKYISTIFYDKTNKRVFLGSLSEGLFVLQLHIFNPIQSLKQISTSTTYAQFPFNNSTVLFSNGELLSTEGTGGKLPLISSHSNNYSMVIDRHKNIWSQRDQSVYQLSPNGNQLLQTFNFPDRASCLYMDDDGLLWIGTMGGIYTVSTGLEKSLPKLVTKLKDVNFIKKKNEELWIGTFKGLYRYQLKKKTLSIIPQLENANIRSILTRKDEVWISTYGDGFYLYKNGHLTKMPLDYHKYLNHAHCLIEDKNGFFWISTNKGLFQVAINDLLAYSKKELTEVYYAYYNKAAGFNSNEFNGGCQPCGSVLNNGFFVFPSLAGSVLFNPLTITPELPNKPIYIDKIRIDNAEIAKKDTLNISQDFERLEVQVSSPYFGTPYNLQFEYRLSTDGNWVKLTEKTIVFSKLQHGTYLLYIRKLNGFNSRFTLRKLTIIVSPYFYQTWWFYAILIILVAAALTLFIKKRTRMILLENERLENLVRKRTEDLEVNIISLEESQYLLGQQTSFQKKLLAAITHDLKSPLRYMMMMGKQLYKNESAGSLIKENIMAIYVSANSMYHLTENLLNYSKLFNTEKIAKDDYINLNLLVAEKIEVFSEMAKYNHTVIYNHIPSTIILYTNRIMLSVIIHNLLDNAIKFCPNGRIDFDAENTEDKVSFLVQDTGCGMPAALLHWLNAEDKSKENQELTNGLGLRMVKEFAAKMDLQIAVESESTTGTKIRLTLMRTN